MNRMQLMVSVSILILAVSLHGAQAAFEPIELEINPSYIKTDLRQPAKFEMTITNNMVLQDNLRVMVDGPYIHWATSPIIMLVVPANTTKAFNITFFPIEHRGTFDFDINISSFINPDVQIKRGIQIYVPPSLIVGNFTAQRVGGGVIAGIDTDAISPIPANITFTLSGSGEEISSYSDGFELSGRQRIEQELFMPDNPMAGDYIVSYDINGNFTGEQAFRVEPVHDIDREEEVSSNFWHADVDISYTNNGNVVESGIVTEERLPGDSFTGHITGPSSCDSSGKLCNYVLPDLAPGETAMISYRVEYWPVYLQILSAVLIVAIFVGYFFVRATKPTITKRTVRKGGNVHSIILEIRNPFLHHLKDVVVRDWVSPLAKVMEHERGIKPVLKRSDAGTEIIYKIGEIRPKEVRYLSYRIKSLIEGDLKMPKAYARYRSKGIRSRSYSKPVMLK